MHFHFPNFHQYAYIYIHVVKHMIYLFISILPKLIEKLLYIEAYLFFFMEKDTKEKPRQRIKLTRKD